MTRRSLIAPAALVFDFDLTLADSRQGFVAGHRYAAQQLSLPEPSFEAISRAIGTPLEKIIPSFFPGIGVPEATEYARLYRQKADEVMLGLTVMLPGAAQAVTELHDFGLRLAIVSQKLRHLVEEVLQREHILRCFDAVLGGDDVPDFKPDPRGLRIALERLGAEPDDAIYIGDTTIDAQAAANANLRFIGVLTGPTTRTEMEAYPNVGLLDSVSDLPGYLAV